MYKARIGLLLILTLTWLLTACQPVGAPAAQPAESAAAAEAPLTQVKVQLAWVKQGEFHGIFNAIEQGFYREAGLEVEVLAGGPDVRGVQIVASGAAEFGIGAPSVVIASRANGVPLKMVAQSFQDSFTVYIAKKARGYETIEDIKGAKFGVWFGGGEYEPQLMAEKAGVGAADVNWVAQKFSMTEFYEDQLDVASATLHNELHVVLGDGYKREDLTIFRASDFGAAMVADGIYTTEEMISSKPEIVQAFLDATMRGWKWGLQNGNEAAEIVLKFSPELDLQKQVYQVEEVNKLITSRAAQEHGLGYMDPQDWAVSQEALLALKAIDAPIDLAAAYDASFWEKIPEAYTTLADLDMAAINERIAKNLGE
jgi:NitT/TauT family transport system substrate-binding protein